MTKDRNYSPLHQNGRIIWIRRDLSLLPKEGRPLSRSLAAEEMYAARKDLYASFSDIVLDNDTTLEEAADRIMEQL